MKKFFVSIALLSLFTFYASADFSIVLRDKSALNVSTDAVFEFRASFDKDTIIKIPHKSIRSVELAPRLSEEEEEVVKQKVPELWHNNFKNRDKAQKELSIYNERLFWFLRDFAIEDAEGKKRVDKLLSPYNESPPRRHDRITLSNANFHGKLLNNWIHCKNETLGNFKIETKNILKISSSNFLLIDASKYSTDKVWYNTEIEVRQGNVLNIWVSGEIDVFSPTPRKFVCNADRYILMENHFEITHMGFPFVKIGENGNSIRLYGQNEITIQSDGILHFAVGANTWNSQNRGSYNIEILHKN